MPLIVQTLPDVFRKLISLAASQTGNRVNYSHLAEIVGQCQHRYRIPESHAGKPFIGGKRAEIKSVPKVYFLNNGIRNVLSGGFAATDEKPDIRPLTENLVLAEICKNTNPLLDTNMYWRSSSGAEVDFVVRRPNELLAIEVKSGEMKRPKISRSLRSFIEAYRPDRTFILNQSGQDTLTINGSEVINLTRVIKRTWRSEDLFRAEVFRFLKREGKISDELISKLLKWRNSGFSVDD